MSGLAEIGVEIIPTAEAYWTPSTRTISMPTFSEYADDENEALDFLKGWNVHESSHIIFCPDITGENIQELIKHDPLLLEIINVFADINNEFKVSDVFPHLTPYLVGWRKKQVLKMPRILKTDHPFMQILYRCYALMEYKAEYPPKYEQLLIDFIDEVVKDFHAENIKDCSGEKLISFSIDVWKRWRKLLETRKSLVKRLESKIGRAMKDLADLIKKGASKEKLDKANKKIEDLGKQLEKAKECPPYRDKLNRQVVAKDVKEGSKGVASEEDLVVVKRKISDQNKLTRQVKQEMQPGNVIADELKQNPPRIIPVKEMEFRRPPPDYDKKKGYEYGKRLNKLLKQKVFLQKSYETKHRNGFMDMEQIRNQIAKYGKLASGAIFQRKNFFTRGGEWMVEVLCDASGSMTCDDKMSAAKQALLTVGVALDGLPDVHYSLRAFTTDRLNDPLDIVVKDYKERKLNISKIDKLAAHWGNIEGVNIRGAAKRMLKHRGMNHLIIVISDGEPAGHCVAGLSPEEDVKRAVEFSRAYGIEVIGIGIPGVHHFDFPKMYPVHHMFDTTEGFYKELARLIVKALRKGR